MESTARRHLRECLQRLEWAPGATKTIIKAQILSDRSIDWATLRREVAGTTTTSVRNWKVQLHGGPDRPGPRSSDYLSAGAIIPPRWCPDPPPQHHRARLPPPSSPTPAAPGRGSGRRGPVRPVAWQPPDAQPDPTGTAAPGQSATHPAPFGPATDGCRTTTRRLTAPHRRADAHSPAVSGASAHTSLAGSRLSQSPGRQGLHHSRPGFPLSSAPALVG